MSFYNKVACPLYFKLEQIDTIYRLVALGYKLRQKRGLKSQNIGLSMKFFLIMDNYV